jgi:hypothetical protein
MKMADPKNNIAPAGWKQVKGRKGYFRQEFGRGEIIWAPAFHSWWLAVPRGQKIDNSNAASYSGDWWGPWKLEQETTARAAIEDWHRRLEKAGWFGLVPGDDGSYDKEQIYSVLSKMPRTCGLPDYFRQTLDERAVAAGRARSGDTLKVGGADLYWRRPHPKGMEKIIFGTYDTHAELIAKPAGAPDNLMKNIRFRLDGPSLDAMIEFLMTIRAGVLSDEAYQSRWRLINSIGGSLSRNADGSIAREQVAQRCERMVHTAQAIDEIIAGLAEGIRERPEDIKLFGLIMSILGNGDRIAGITVVPDGAQPEVIAVTVDPRSTMAMAAAMEMAVDGQDHDEKYYEC